MTGKLTIETAEAIAREKGCYNLPERGLYIRASECGNIEYTITTDGVIGKKISREEAIAELVPPATGAFPAYTTKALRERISYHTQSNYFGEHSKTIIDSMNAEIERRKASAAGDVARMTKRERSRFFDQHRRRPDTYPARPLDFLIAGSHHTSDP